MGQGDWANSVRHDVLVSTKSSVYRVPRPESVFQDVQGVAPALMLNFLDQSRVQIFLQYWDQALVHDV